MPKSEIKYFFSYAHRDMEFALKLAKELRAVGVNLWLDQLDILGGQRWDRAIEGALERCDGMLAILSPESLASDNVMDEISYALEKGKLIIPILLRPCGIPFRLRRVQHVDFIADYGMGFSQLLRALRIEQLPVEAEPPQPEEQLTQASEGPAAEFPAHSERKYPKEHIAYSAAPQSPIDFTTHPMTPMIQFLRTKLRGAFVGAVIGTIWGAVAALFSRYSKDWLFGAGIVGIAGAISGAMSVARRAIIFLMAAGVIAGFGLWMIIDTEVVRAEIYGVSVGAIGGATVGLIVKRWKGRA